MTTSPNNTKRIVVIDASDPTPGRFNPARFRNPKPDDGEARPIVTPDDNEATRAELEELRRRMARKHA